MFTFNDIQHRTDPVTNLEAPAVENAVSPLFWKEAGPLHPDKAKKGVVMFLRSGLYALLIIGAKHMQGQPQLVD